MVYDLASPSSLTFTQAISIEEAVAQPSSLRLRWLAKDSGDRGSLSKSGLRWQAIFFTERVLLPQRLAFISNHDGRGVAAAAALRELPCSMHAPSPARSLLAPKEPRRRLRPEGASPAASLEGASPAASLEGAWPAASLVGACPLKGLNSSQLGCARRTRCCGRPAATLLHSSQQS
jgi:hypothetical protein